MILLRGMDVELTMGRDLLGFALVIGSLGGVIWILSLTRRAPH